MAQLPYAALRKAKGAVFSSRVTPVETIVGVEPVEVHLDVLQARCAARGIADPIIIGDSLRLRMNALHEGSLEEELMTKAMWDNGGKPS